MKIFRTFMLTVAICFICNIILAEDETKVNKLYENITVEMTEDISELLASREGKNKILKSGTIIDDKTLTVLESHRRYNELASLQLATVQLAIKKANNDYFNTFKIWLALHGVKQKEFDDWEIKENKAVLKLEDKE